MGCVPVAIIRSRDCASLHPRAMRLGRLVFAAALGATLLAATPRQVLACSYAPLPVSEIAAAADRVVLGRVLEVAGEYVWTYTIEVELVIKGDPLPQPWIIDGAGSSDCGMPRLNAGEHVVLEYYKPGRMYDGPWFYAWKFEPDGTIGYWEAHQPIEPPTLTQLLAEYAALGLPETSTEPLAGPEPASWLPPATGLLWAVLLLLGWRARWDSNPRHED